MEDGHRRGHSLLVLFAGLFCTFGGLFAETTLVGKLVYDLTGRELDLGFLGLCQFAPAMALVLVTGTVADRFDRRHVASLGLVAHAAVALGLLLYAGSGPTAVGPIFALTILSGTARAFLAPACRALPADLVPATRLPWVVARYAGTRQTALIVAPVVAGVLYEVGTNIAFAFVAAAYVAAAGAFQLLHRRVVPSHAVVGTLVEAVPVGEPVPALREPSRLHEALEGLRLIRRNRILLGAISLDLFAVLFGGAIALLPAIAEDRLGLGAVGLGWLRAADGMGAAVVTLVLAFRPLRRRVGTMLFASVAVFGVATVVLGITRNAAIAFAAILVLAGADAVSVFVRGTLAPLVTPPGLRGRVNAVEGLFIGASNELGQFESGVAGQVLGAGGAVVLGGVATVLVAVAWGTLFPELREVDRFPEAWAPEQGVRP